MGRKATTMLAKTETTVDLRHHVLVTEPGAEFKAQRHLKASGFDPWVPTEKIVQVRRVRTHWGEIGRKHNVIRPIFRGYVFVPLNMMWSFGPLYSTPGLRQSPFLLICGKPAIVPHHEVARLKSVEIDLKNAPVQGLPYVIGETVRITQGAFTGFTAEINRLDDRGRIELLMQILGAETKLHLAVEQIEKL
jgi:transcriptional antiterminator NusG